MGCTILSVPQSQLMKCRHKDVHSDFSQSCIKHRPTQISMVTETALQQASQPKRKRLPTWTNRTDAEISNLLPQLEKLQ